MFLPFPYEHNHSSLLLHCILPIILSKPLQKNYLPTQQQKLTANMQLNCITFHCLTFITNFIFIKLDWALPRLLPYDVTATNNKTVITDINNLPDNKQYLIASGNFYPFPFSNLIKNIIPLKQSSIHIASQTPLSPIEGARHEAKLRRTAHILTKFIMLGMSVSPVPIKTP